MAINQTLSIRELVGCIFKYLKPEEAAQMRLVCKLWKSVADPIAAPYLAMGEFIKYKRVFEIGCQRSYLSTSDDEPPSHTPEFFYSNGPRVVETSHGDMGLIRGPYSLKIVFYKSGTSEKIRKLDLLNPKEGVTLAPSETFFSAFFITPEKLCVILKSGIIQVWEMNGAAHCSEWIQPHLFEGQVYDVSLIEDGFLIITNHKHALYLYDLLNQGEWALPTDQPIGQMESWVYHKRTLSIYSETSTFHLMRLSSGRKFDCRIIQLKQAIPLVDFSHFYGTDKINYSFTPSMDWMTISAGLKKIFILNVQSGESRIIQVPPAKKYGAYWTLSLFRTEAIFASNILMVRQWWKASHDYNPYRFELEDLIQNIEKLSIRTFLIHTPTGHLLSSTDLENTAPSFPLLYGMHQRDNTLVIRLENPEESRDYEFSLDIPPPPPPSHPKKRLKR